VHRSWFIKWYHDVTAAQNLALGFHPSWLKIFTQDIAAAMGMTVALLPSEKRNFQI
jgi:hypothetical protein